MLLLLVSGVSYWSLAKYLEQDSLLFLADEVREVREVVKKCPQNPEEQLHGEGVAHWFSPYYVKIWDTERELVAASPKTPDIADRTFPPPLGVYEYFGRTARYHADDGRTFLLIAALAETLDKHSPWLLHVALDITHDETVLAKYRRTLTWASILGLVLFTGLAMWVAHYGVRPLRTITRTMQRVTAQHLHERIAPLQWPRELRTLASEYDEMLNRLEDAFSRLRQFSSDLAHELRTPIQNLMGDTEVTLSKKRTAAAYEELLTLNLDERKHLAHMVEDLLFLARAESPQHEMQCEWIDGLEALREVWDFFDAMAERQGISVVYQGQGMIHAEPRLFRRAITNLPSNALRHTPKGGTIMFVVEPSKENGMNGMRVQVVDAGEGIHPSHLPRLFDRLYRVDPGRSRRTEGTGLGLAIVKSIMALHGGTVSVQSMPSKGSIFSLHFPAPLETRR